MKFGKFAVALAGAAMLAGCAGIRDHRGAVLDQEIVQAIQPGVDNKESVQKLLGSPSFTGQFTPNEWYYVARDTGTFAFRNARVLDQTVLRIRFDEAGNVVGASTTGEELIAAIDPVDDQTPTLGRRRGLLQEIFGNIGTVGAGLPGSAPPQQ